jgi:outer membrane lipoprotein
MNMKTLLLILACFAGASGCAHVIKEDVLSQVNREISFCELLKDPGAYKGQLVLLGGVIVDAVNMEKGTRLEVYQTELDREGMPVRVDVSEGRFLALHRGFLEIEIFRKGRRVTIAGTVEGERVRKLGEIDYRYPYLVIEDMYLWKEDQARFQDAWPRGFWSPWWDYPWHPWPERYWRY